MLQAKQVSESVGRSFGQDEPAVEAAGLEAAGAPNKLSGAAAGAAVEAER